MRLGLIIYGTLNTVSGGYLYDRQLVRYLRQQGDEVQVISLPWTRYGRHLLQNFHSTLRQKVQQPAFDLILQDELNHPSLFLFNKRLQRLDTCPLVSIVHHLRSNEAHPSLLLPFYRYVERQYLRTIDGFVFNSKTTRASVSTLLKQQKPHVVAYPSADHHRLATDPESIVQRTRDPGPLRLIFVGNIIPRKGCHLLIQALADLPQGSWQLNMVGDMTIDPPYVRRLQSHASASGIRPYIHWHGRLADPDLTRLLITSDVLTVPSTYEGFGIVYLEAMRYGLPAIATTSGAAHEIITDGVDGFLVPTADPLTLASRLQALNNDRSLLARQSLAAFERAHEHPTWADSMSHVRRFFLSMVT